MAIARISAGDFDYIRELVRVHSALLLEPGKEYLVESRLDPVVRREGFPSFAFMIARLRSLPFNDLHRQVVEAMTNNETMFFRDARMFAMLKQTILPEIVTRRAAQRSINIWSAACSSGQEPHSVAMLLREFRPSLEGWKSTIIASDMSLVMLARARSGAYSQFEVNRGLPAALLVKYFEQNRATWEISPSIRRMVDYREINLIQPWAVLPRMDVILMRNVLIYLDVETRRSILSRVARALAPGGYLILGGAETTNHLHEAFEPASLADGLCFRLREPAPRALSTLAMAHGSR
jgi:chemotaxis protein methyltransferase CheR